MVRRILQFYGRMIVAFVILALTANVATAGSFRPRVSEPSVYNLKHLDSQTDNQAMTPAASLGSFSADGGSPGYIIARTYSDRQQHFGPRRAVEWRGGPQIHFTWTQQYVPGADPSVSANFLMYNVYDPADAPIGAFVWVYGFSLNPSPFIRSTQMPQADVDETGHMVIAGHSFDPGASDYILTPEVFWDTAAIGTYGRSVGDTIPKSLATDPEGSQSYPVIEYQEYGGQYYTHLAVKEASSITYWRRVGGNGTFQGWEPPVLITDDFVGSFFISSSREFPGGIGGKVAVCWTQYNDPDHATSGDNWGATPAYRESNDAGSTWGPVTRLLNFDPNEDNQVAWLEAASIYDSDGYLHIVFNTRLYHQGNAESVDPSRILHWTDRTAGPNAGGTLSTVTVADFRGLTRMCGRGGTNVLNVGKPLISECNGRLYTLWQQFGDLDAGDTADCASESMIAEYGYNADIFMSVSVTLDGLLWDVARNLTNSKTPGCDTTLDNECDADNYPTSARYGMNTADFAGIFWEAVRAEVFAVRDQLDAAYPEDGYYLDVFYVDDLLPGIAAWDPRENVPIWTNNPLKWFRLPCIPPVLMCRMYISQSDYTHPANWVKSGTEKSFEVKIENTGNDVLNVTSITANLSGATPSGAVQITPTSLTVDAGSSDYVQVTINPGGTISPPAGTAVPIEAEVVFTGNDQRNPTYSFLINTVVADTVAQIVWDSVYTGASSAWQLALTVSNNGSAGHLGTHYVNMDFVNTGLECDTDDASVYLYDLCPVIMSDPTHYSWNPYWTGEASQSFNFVPVSDGAHYKHTSGSFYDSFQSDKFVNSDSSIAMAKTWLAPKEDISYVVERIDVWSNDGAIHPGVCIGELVDWDVPSDMGTNNRGGWVADPGSVDYLWQQGLEYNPGADCHDNDRRLAASGLLGYYTQAEFDADGTINHTGLRGGAVLLKSDLFEPFSDLLIPDSVWTYLNRAGLSANNAEAGDRSCLLSIGTFDISPDPLIIWVVHATIYDGDLTTLQTAVDRAESWYIVNRSIGPGPTICCGRYTGGYTGNTDCDKEGKMGLADITRLIDRVYLSKLPLCCEANGNVDGDDDGRLNLADITKLIDHIYLTKKPTAFCY